jgi:DNA replication and repair protein RecF
VHVSHLALANFRNYRRLGLELAPGVAVFCGQNGQGKTNLLEAVYVLATTRSPRTRAERELVTWRRMEDDLESAAGAQPFARVEGRVKRREGEVHLEVLFIGEPTGSEQDGAQEGGAVGEFTGRLARTIKVNGLPARAAELLGQLTVVYFGPEDVALAGGPPAGRRRYLDLANSQVAPLYLRALQQYNRVLLQRNLVLRQVRERRQPLAAIEPWTDQLVRTGVFILRHRLRMLAMLGERARVIFSELAGTSQSFQLAYRSTVCNVPDGLRQSAQSGELAVRYRARLGHLAAREVEQAVSLVGPHRDDFAFLLDGVDLHAYGSRGQQRLAVLALKLAEADWMHSETGEMPVLLLDDVLSELDPPRRHYLLDRIAAARGEAGAVGSRQVWITTTDTESFPADFLATAQRFNIDAGTARPA